MQTRFGIGCLLSGDTQEPGCEQMAVRRMPAPSMHSVRRQADETAHVRFRARLRIHMQYLPLPTVRGRLRERTPCHAPRTTPEAGRRICDVCAAPRGKVLNAAREEHFARQHLDHISRYNRKSMGTHAGAQKWNHTCKDNGTAVATQERCVRRGTEPD